MKKYILLCISITNILFAQNTWPTPKSSGITYFENYYQLGIAEEIQWVLYTPNTSDIQNIPYTFHHIKGFNRTWNKINTSIRKFALMDSIWVITGPIYSDFDSTLKYKGTRVPGRIYVIITNYKFTHGIAYIFTNCKNIDIHEYSTTINEVEKETQINFFPNLNIWQSYYLENEISPHFLIK